MGIRLEDQTLLLTLDEALALARSTEELPAVWITRVDRLGGLGVKTYIAALGGALLAKAADPRVDSLAQDEAAGPRGYSLRKAAEFLAQQNDGRYHLGAEGRWPLNNRPFLGGPARIDEFTKISGKARPAYEAFLDALRDLESTRAHGSPCGLGGIPSRENGCSRGRARGSPSRAPDKRAISRSRTSSGSLIGLSGQTRKGGGARRPCPPQSSTAPLTTLTSSRSTVLILAMSGCCR